MYTLSRRGREMKKKKEKAGRIIHHEAEAQSQLNKWALNSGMPHRFWRAYIEGSLGIRSWR